LNVPKEATAGGSRQRERRSSWWSGRREICSASEPNWSSGISSKTHHFPSVLLWEPNARQWHRQIAAVVAFLKRQAMYLRVDGVLSGRQGYFLLPGVYSTRLCSCHGFIFVRGAFHASSRFYNGGLRTPPVECCSRCSPKGVSARAVGAKTIAHADSLV